MDGLPSVPAKELGLWPSAACKDAAGALGVGHLCIMPRLRAIDICMPSATPSVTMAVPP